CEIEGISALDTQEVTINAALIAVIAANDLHAAIRPPHSQSCLAAIGTVGAGRVHVRHFPRPSLVAICTGRERAHRTYVNAHAALFALQVVLFVRRDHRHHTAVLHAQRPHVHGLAANAYAAVTQNAARAVEVHHRRPLLLFAVVLGLH